MAEGNSLWGDVFGGALGAYGYSDLMDRLDDQQGKVSNTISGIQSTVDDRLGFEPWGVTSGLGNVNVTEGGIDFEMNPYLKAMRDQQGRGAYNMFDIASMDPTARANQYFEQLQGQRQPDYNRAFNNLNQSVWGSGTGGMRTAEFGGNPMDYRFGKALADSQLQDRLASRQMSMADQLQSANIGNQMFSNMFMPQQMLQDSLKYGLNNRQLQNDMTLGGASLWSQLGLGGVGAEVNYDNIKGKAFGDMIGAGTQAATGIGNNIGSIWDGITGTAGGIWDTVSGLFGGDDDSFLDAIGDSISDGFNDIDWGSSF
jgi:hypothetical protein